MNLHITITNMQYLYNANGLPFYSEDEIIKREYISRTVNLNIQQILLSQNKAWKFERIEAPSLIPTNLINSNYTDDDCYIMGDICLKPETTPSTYVYMTHMLESAKALPPYCVWQISKSFRREQDQSTKHCRFKEFYQQEYQCLYSADTKNDYQMSVIEDIAKLLRNITSLDTRIVLSDRLPSYSIKTIDIEVDNGDKWMEVASISVRTDFPYKPIIKGKEIECRVLEIALGIDRLMYNSNIGCASNSVTNNLT